jgi:hypothetical protein
LDILHTDRIIFSIINKIGTIKGNVTIVEPETVLRWQRELIKRVWTFKTKKRVGRPPVRIEIKQLILSMKNDNLYWGLTMSSKKLVILIFFFVHRLISV